MDLLKSCVMQKIVCTYTEQLVTVAVGICHQLFGTISQVYIFIKSSLFIMILSYQFILFINDISLIHYLGHQILVSRDAGNEKIITAMVYSSPWGTSQRSWRRRPGAHHPGVHPPHLHQFHHRVLCGRCWRSCTRADGRLGEQQA